MSAVRYPEHYAEMFINDKGRLQLTERAIAARGEIIDQLNAHMVPMDELTEKFDVRRNPHAPELFFGFQLPRSEVLKYGVSRGLIPPNHADTMTWRAALLPVLKHLRNITDAILYLRTPYSPTYTDIVVCLYTNYSMEEEQYEEADEEEILYIIKDEFQLNDSPRWYWAIVNS